MPSLLGMSVMLTQMQQAQSLSLLADGCAEGDREGCRLLETPHTCLTRSEATELENGLELRNRGAKSWYEGGSKDAH